MKRLIPTLTFAVALSSAAMVMAGPGGHGHGCDGEGMGPGMRGAHMLEKILDLTDEQKTQLEAIYTQAKDDAPGRGGMGRGAMFDLDPAADGYQQEVNDLAEAAADRARQRVLHHGEIHRQVMAILTDEQKEELKAHHLERKERWKERRGEE